MPRELTGSDIIRVVREEWDARLGRLSEDVGLVLHATIGGEQNNVVSPELKVVHKKSGILYTVDSVGSRDVILRTPEGDKFIVDQAVLEASYELA